MLKMSALAFF